jgi:hypothetical protein
VHTVNVLVIQHIGDDELVQIARLDVRGRFWRIVNLTRMRPVRPPSGR